MARRLKHTCTVHGTEWTSEADACPDCALDPAASWDRYLTQFENDIFPVFVKHGMTSKSAALNIFMLNRQRFMLDQTADPPYDMMPSELPEKPAPPPPPPPA